VACYTRPVQQILLNLPKAEREATMGRGDVKLFADEESSMKHMKGAGYANPQLSAFLSFFLSLFLFLLSSFTNILYFAFLSLLLLFFLALFLCFLLVFLCCYFTSTSPYSFSCLFFIVSCCSCIDFFLFFLSFSPSRPLISSLSFSRCLFFRCSFTYTLYFLHFTSLSFSLCFLLSEFLFCLLLFRLHNLV
jgi:hypothetical protein